MADFRNTSYDQEYVVVSRTATEVVLRPTNRSLLATYWKEFISAEIEDASSGLSIKLLQVPQGVRRAEAFSAIALEYPQVLLLQDEIEIDVSSLVTANVPNPQVPGLYKIEYILPLPGFANNVIWTSYVSVEEPPVLRQVVTPWNRDSYTIANLSRLVLEPVFQEALYEEGAPLYNFVTSNMSPALRPSTARECYQCQGYKAGNNLFVSGHVLPLASSVELSIGTGSSLSLHLDRAVTAAAWQQKGYEAGAIVQVNHQAYCATMACSKDDLPGSSKRWLRGELFSLQETSQDTTSPEATGYKWVHAADGAVKLLAVWAPVDLRGYIFAVDVMHAPKLGTYWGYYDPKHFKDYGPGDLVTYMSDDVLYLYCRNKTDIRDESTEEAYRPGSYQNPHWDEVYASWEQSQLRELGRWIYPVSNATNAVVAKTGSLSEDMCAIYASILGIPSDLVDAIGSKCSVFLYILLQRTRNTYEGFKNAFQAVGLDVSDLRRVYPTVSASGESGAFETVYPAEEALKEVAASLKADLLWREEGNPPDTEVDGLHWMRYWPASGDHPYSEIQKYDGSWTTVYKLTGFGDRGAAEPLGNNRYYRATLSLMDRLAEQALASMGDAYQWIALGSYSDISYWVASILSYEVPIYIYMALTVRVASLGEAYMGGRGSRHLLLSAYGGTPTLIVHPSPYYDLASISTKELRAKVQVQEGSTWSDVEPTSMRGRAAVYDFSHSVTVRFVFDDTVPQSYWTSRYTLGQLGGETESGEIQDAALFTGDQAFVLTNGLVAITPLPPSGDLSIEAACLKYNYTLDGSWASDGTTPFAGYVETEVTANATWLGSIEALASSVTKVTSRAGASIRFSASAEAGSALLQLYGNVPEEIYIYGKKGELIALVRLPDAVGAEDETLATVKLTMKKEVA